MHFLQSRFCIRIWERGEYYLRDHTGKELAIYNLSTGRLKMLNLFGNGLIGRVNVIWDSVLTESDPGIWEYVYNRRDERNYYLKDHLGSIRLTVNESGNIISAQDYYPYGEIIRSYTTGGNVNDKYKFTEKERDTETDYDYFGARFYDSKLVRWLQVDPLADKYPGWSPYNYALNNPIKFIDPNGMDVDEFGMERQGLEGEGMRVLGRSRNSSLLDGQYQHYLKIDNQYIKKTYTQYQSSLAYAMQEGYGLNASYTIEGHLTVSQLMNGNYIGEASATIFSSLLHESGFSSYGWAQMYVDNKLVKKQMLVKPQEPSIHSSGFIGVTIFDLPKSGKVSISITASYEIQNGWTGTIIPYPPTLKVMFNLATYQINN